MSSFNYYWETLWELYHIAKDPAEAHNLAGQHPEKLAEMIARWYVEAGKYQVLPLDGTPFQRLVTDRPQIALPRDQYTFYPDLSPVHISVAPLIYNRPHSITAEVEVPAGRAEGVLLAQGGVAGGYVFYVKDQKLHLSTDSAAAYRFSPSNVARSST